MLIVVANDIFVNALYKYINTINLYKIWGKRLETNYSNPFELFKLVKKINHYLKIKLNQIVLKNKRDDINQYFKK
jgi:hypothetical protein